MKVWTRLSLVLAVLSLLCLAAMAQENSADEWYQKGQELMENESYVEAINAYDKAIEIDSENASIWMHPVEEDQKKEIKVSSEMAAVINTLTPRERSILETLIRHGGRMTQMEMRYETGSPKSSLSMILISLEKRKLIAKREWGRTNVVELSEQFLSGK